MRNDDVTSQKRDDDTPPKTNSPGSPAHFRGRPRTAARFKEREVARLLKAMRRAGGSFRLEFADGSFFIVDQAPATTNTDPTLGTRSMLRTKSGLPKHCYWNTDRHGVRRVRFRKEQLG
jgi:hypothetical protein